jgi:chemotaxis protein CheX
LNHTKTMHTIDILKVQGFITDHVQRVFETMFSQATAAEPAIVRAPGLERISGSVGFAGETVTGAVYLHLSATVACLLSACMLGTSAQDLSEAEVNDVVGELTNMLTGGLKSWLCDSGAPCAVSTPGIIRGSSFVVEPPPDVQRLFLPFSSGPNPFAVEVHIRFR